MNQANCLYTVRHNSRYFSLSVQLLRDETMDTGDSQDRPVECEILWRASTRPARGSDAFISVVRRRRGEGVPIKSSASPPSLARNPSGEPEKILINRWA